MKIFSTLQPVRSMAINRRNFLSISGVAAGVAVAAASCQKSTTSPSGSGGSFDVGSGDVGYLNMAYAVTQINEAFYTQVVATPYANISALEKSYMAEYKDEEFTHQYLLQQVLSSNAIAAINIDLSVVNFTDRTQALTAGKLIANIAVATYNYAIPRIKNSNYMPVLGKMVSTIARKSAVLGNLISFGSLYDSSSVDASTGMEINQTPSTVLTTINAYLKTKITAKSL